MQLFGAGATMFSNAFFDHKKLKKPPSKIAQKYFFFQTVALQKAQIEEFIFQNVS